MFLKSFYKCFIKFCIFLFFKQWPSYLIPTQMRLKNMKANTYKVHLKIFSAHNLLISLWSINCLFLNLARIYSS